MFAILMSKKGRAGLALPFDAILKVTTFGMTLIIMAIALIVWPIYTFWTEISYVITFGLIFWWIAHMTRKAIRAYRKGKAS